MYSFNKAIFSLKQDFRIKRGKRSLATTFGRRIKYFMYESSSHMVYPPIYKKTYDHNNGSNREVALFIKVLPKPRPLAMHWSLSLHAYLNIEFTSSQSNAYQMFHLCGSPVSGFSQGKTIQLIWTRAMNKEVELSWPISSPHSSKKIFSLCKHEVINAVEHPSLKSIEYYWPVEKCALIASNGTSLRWEE